MIEKRLDKITGTMMMSVYKNCNLLGGNLQLDLIILFTFIF